MNKQTCKFVSRLVDNFPDMDSHIMQGWIQNPKALKRALEEAFYPSIGNLRLISGATQITIKPTDGTDTISKAAKRGVFGQADQWFHGEANVKSAATKEIAAQVYEMNKNGTVEDLLVGLGDDVDRLCFTQSQIVEFIANNGCTLQGNTQNFYLLKVKDKIFVTIVYGTDSWMIHFYGDYATTLTWSVNKGHRFVIPKLSPTS